MLLYSGILKRSIYEDKQTLGALVICHGAEPIFLCQTLELPWRNNEPFNSCIPLGKYQVERRHSPRYGNHWEILGVKDRDLILIHGGNFHRDTEGCVLVGKDLIDIDRDGYKDVTSSRTTMRHLNNVIEFNTWMLTVAD